LTPFIASTKGAHHGQHIGFIVDVPQEPVGRHVGGDLPEGLQLVEKSPVLLIRPGGFNQRP
jgi:hypothetical protein